MRPPEEKRLFDPGAVDARCGVADPGNRDAVTIEDRLLAEIDAATRNRSRFLADAAR